MVQKETSTSEFKKVSESLGRAREEIHKVLVGQEVLVDRLFMGLLVQGHLLLEGLPGLAKTLAVKTFAKVLDLTFSRIQFTPDLLPADLVGTRIYLPDKGSFRTQKGPVFAHVVLADEINRAPAKVQSALLEAMQERQVTLGPETYALEEPFLVLATQNPIEQEGTYPLPEAQLDRFLFKVYVDYPAAEEEKEVLNRMDGKAVPEPARVLTASSVLKAQKTAAEVQVSDTLRDYIVQIVAATRRPEVFGLSRLKAWVAYGASPRGSLGLAAAARARALLAGRDYAVPQDVKDVALDVLRHRLVLSYEAQARDVSPDEILRQILEAVPVP